MVIGMNLVKKLKLGIANALAQECEFKAYQDYRFELTLRLKKESSNAK